MKFIIVMWCIFFSCFCIYAETGVQISIFYTSEKKVNMPDHSASDKTALVEIFTGLKQVRKEDSDDMHFDQYDNKEQCIDEIIGLLIEMYKKIINATIIYYFLGSLGGTQNLGEKISEIIIEDSAKIIDVIEKHCMQIFLQPHVTWQKKVQYCIIAFGVAIGVKFAADSVLPESNSHKIENLEEKDVQESGYIKEKFGNWRNSLSNTR